MARTENNNLHSFLVLRDCIFRKLHSLLLVHLSPLASPSTIPWNIIFLACDRFRFHPHIKSIYWCKHQTTKKPFSPRSPAEIKQKWIRQMSVVARGSFLHISTAILFTRTELEKANGETSIFDLAGDRGGSCVVSRVGGTSGFTYVCLPNNKTPININASLDDAQ